MISREKNLEWGKGNQEAAVIYLEFSWYLTRPNATKKAFVY
ncbi:hypothetical protein HNQ94_002709 [Salirhabdus euzebyi]|uniref:Uncharacterized protein n=1 Tax=Salirhabdus euzebyi TaxID=394506 RepID=A0A841Q7C3_9BACI|nr:hypothetical protein [Salirhabdus euzebyi]